MKSPEKSSRIASRSRLLKLLETEFSDARQAHELFAEFLQHTAYDSGFCLKLLAVARQGADWDIRRLAVLMLEHQILKLDPAELDEFDALFTQLKLKQSRGCKEPLLSSVLKEGYSTTELRGFIPEFRRKLARLKHVHDKLDGRKTPDSAIHDFIQASRRDCKLTLARYLFTPDEVVDEILRRVQVTRGVRDLDTAQHAPTETELKRALNSLPDYEGKILSLLCQTANIYWVSEETSSAINSLVEYPLTTVVLTIKPPGSEIEFEIKRAGRRGHQPLGVVYARNGQTVPPSHRLDGGNMLWLSQYEASAAARLRGIYRLVHGTEAPIAYYVGRSTIYSVPAREAEVQTIPFFTNPQLFGKGYREMRAAMKASVDAFIAEGNELLPNLYGDLGLTAQFLGHVAPAQAILCGTTSFRLDKLAIYLSASGPETYFKQGLGVAYSKQDERRLADELLEEVLGIYQPPQDNYRSYEQYVTAAFRVEENRSRADEIYLSLLRQIAEFWGTLLAIRGYSRGESFVARNVGLKSCWDGGQWRVKIIFMDHDSLVMPGPHDEKFYARGGLPNMAFDDSYIWGKASPAQFARSAVGRLQSIYRIADNTQGQAEARAVLKAAYRKTQREMLSNPKLRSVFHKAFLERLLDWDKLVGGHFRLNGDKAAAKRWKKEMKEMLAAKGYGKEAFEAYMQTIEENKIFLERNRDLFELETNNGG
jgi:hypothetical protein